MGESAPSIRPLDHVQRHFRHDVPGSKGGMEDSPSRTAGLLSNRDTQQLAGDGIRGGLQSRDERSAAVRSVAKVRENWAT